MKLLKRNLLKTLRELFESSPKVWTDLGTFSVPIPDSEADLRLAIMNYDFKNLQENFVEEIAYVTYVCNLV